MNIISKIFGDANGKYLNSINPLVEEINKLEEKFKDFSLEDLKKKTLEFKAEFASGKSSDDILPEAFAAVREATKRTLNKRHFDVQLMGGIILHEGKIAEMKTGEGKTLAATLPAFLNALRGKGVHIVTVNDHLARRDAVWMGQIYNALGLSVACINHEASYIYDQSHKEDLDKERDETGSFRVMHEFLRPVTRREAYEADITYGTNNEFGFDYLRDNMAYDKSQIVQAKGHNFAIVDEVDSILIDEARTPLIISAPDSESTKLYEVFAKITPRLKENEDYNVDEKLKAATITEKGIEKVEKALGIKNIYEEGGTRYAHQMEQALKAHALFHRDKDYVVKDGEVIIVDEFTGRLMPGRSWSGGLHQAIEAKEGVSVKKESRTMATITFQNYFRFYKKLSGMTGTAQTSAEEFDKVYGIDVISVPTNKPMVRKDFPDRIYKTQEGKMRAVAREIMECHKKGQPVLVGTVSITKNEVLSAMLKREGIPHQVLNAKNHEREAEIIAQAGRRSAITVATNMAGRGIDIILGGNPYVEKDAEEVKKAGGLHVIGTERHEARRIDNQLRGRAGRQGDPGSSQFFVSTEDDLARIFGGDRLRGIMETLGVKEDEPVEHSFISKAIEQAQSKVEGYNFDLRKHVLDYDDVMNKHREVAYGLRYEALMSDSVRDKILDYIYAELDKIVDAHIFSANSGKFKETAGGVEEVLEGVKSIIPLEEEIGIEFREAAKDYDSEKIKDFIHKLVDSNYQKREQELGMEAMRQLEKNILLRVIDELWVDHLEQMEYLRDSIGLRAYGQLDPLVEYKVEAQKMFIELQAAISSQIANLIFKITLVRETQEKELKEERQNVTIGGQKENNNARGENRGIAAKRALSVEGKKIGRNDPCPCGAVNPKTGKPYKYKKCGLINAPYHKR